MASQVKIRGQNGAGAERRRERRTKPKKGERSNDKKQQREKKGSANKGGCHRMALSQVLLTLLLVRRPLRKTTHTHTHALETHVTLCFFSFLSICTLSFVHFTW